jgi:acyl-CoA reductase-like NAD-dependent aldehyde dehydrogenase
MAGEGLPHVPLLRGGKVYRSLATTTLTDLRTGETVAEMSQALPGMISRDLLDAERSRRALEERSTEELVAMCRRAAELFLDAELPLAEPDGVLQSQDDYLQQLAATAGMPVAMGRSNMDKIVRTLESMDAVLGGLTRGLDLKILDQGYGVQDDRRLSYLRQADSLGVVLPNNSPGVHTLWLPAIPLKTPLTLRPGSAEPWTPLRICQAFLAAGCPPEALGLYPSGHDGANQVLLSCRRAMVFGDQSTVERWSSDLRVQAHGPGWSKVFLDRAEGENWRQYLDLIAESVAANGGRSCINLSSVRTAAAGRELALALAERLAAVEARPLDDPEAELAAFANPAVARRISEIIDHQLAQGGAEDLTARFRSGDRVAQAGGCTFLRPTVIWCEDPGHPLAEAEYGFPFVSVLEVPEEKLVETAGFTLVATVLGEGSDLRHRALVAENIDRLNLGAIPTHHIAWDQPHEGNLFDHLYKQRAFQAA